MGDSWRTVKAQWKNVLRRVSYVRFNTKRVGEIKNENVIDFSTLQKKMLELLMFQKRLVLCVEKKINFTYIQTLIHTHTIGVCYTGILPIESSRLRTRAKRWDTRKINWLIHPRSVRPNIDVVHAADVRISLYPFVRPVRPRNTIFVCYFLISIIIIVVYVALLSSRSSVNWGRPVDET